MANYILDEQGNPVKEDNIYKWGEWFEYGDRCVARTELLDGMLVSTVFLGVDHSFGDGPPILYETCIFKSREESEVVRRYCTKEEAAAGHLEVVGELNETHG